MSRPAPGTPDRPDTHEREDAPVIVVGAGPAGSVTALLLARRGVPVLLLDRSQFPRPKACGDCLSAAATDLLLRLGLLEEVMTAGATWIDHWRIIAPDGTRATGRFGDAAALSLERRRLDPVLLRAAIEAGARFRTAHVTELVVREGRVTGVKVRDGADAPSVLGARLVVGADGLRSVVARRLDLVRRHPRLRKVSLTAHLPAPDDPLHHGEMHLIPDGCLGYAPAGQGLINLTLVVTTEAAQSLGSLGPGAFFRNHLRHVPSLERRLQSSLHRLESDSMLTSGPFDVPTRSPISRGAALVGDAAGYYDPFTGQGIYHAMAAAELLVDAIAPALSRDPLEHGLQDYGPLDRGLRRYDRVKRRLTAPAHGVQRGVEWVLSRPWLANRVLSRLSVAPTAMDRLIAVAGDLRRPASLLSPAVVSSFILPSPGGSIDPHR